MSELIPESDRQWQHPQTRAVPAARLDCQGCPVAAGEVPDASCAECVVTVFLAAELLPPDGG